MKPLRKSVLLSSAALLGTALLTSCTMNKNGKEQTVTIDDVPAAARATIEKHTAGATIQGIEREDEHGKAVYEVEATKDGKRWEFEVGADGSLLEEPKEGKDDGEDDDREEKGDD